MSHHGHFVQSRLTIEDNNVAITHVPFHLEVRYREGLSEGGILSYFTFKHPLCMALVHYQVTKDNKM